MKGAFRKSMNWLHTWTGLALGWLLFFVFLTGTLGYFDTEMDRWMEPELPTTAKHVPEDQLIAMALEHLEYNAEESKQWQIILPQGREDMLRIAWKKPDTGKPMRHGRSMQREIIDHETNEIAEVRDTAGGQGLYRMHYRLHYMPSIVGFWIVGLATMFMLLALVTGIVIHIKIFKDFFTFRPKEGARSWLDAHSVVSVLALPFHIMITYSGLVFFMFTYMGMVFIANYDTSEMKNVRSEAFPRIAPFEASGNPGQLTDLNSVLATARKDLGSDHIYRISIDHPMDADSVIMVRRHDTSIFRNAEVDRFYYKGTTGEKLELNDPIKPVASDVRSVFTGLHEGHFAGTFMRWLYFISGLLGTAMIATGMLLWVEKRRFKNEVKNAPTKGYLLVKRTNIGIIVGLPLAIAVYFLANRLLPVEMADRSAWEMNSLFITLGLALLYPFIRPAKTVWYEMLSLTAIALLAVPIVSAITTRHSMLSSFNHQDWTLFTYDLMLVVFGLAFAIAALYMKKRQSETPKPKRAGRSKGKRPQPKAVEAIATRNISNANSSAITNTAHRTSHSNDYTRT